MQVLVVDDLRVFSFPAVYARTSSEALELVPSAAWDELWLDHDLGGTDTIVPVIPGRPGGDPFQQPGC